jgi:hypothetical protein
MIGSSSSLDQDGFRQAVTIYSCWPSPDPDFVVALSMKDRVTSLIGSIARLGT